jgi:hypothetical protein
MKITLHVQQNSCTTAHLQLVKPTQAAYITNTISIYISTYHAFRTYTSKDIYLLTDSIYFIASRYHVYSYIIAHTMYLNTLSKLGRS